MASRCGYSADLSLARSTTAPCSTPTTPITCRPRRITTKRMKTNTVSNTAFRGFGGPQGMMVAERVIDEIAWALGLDPLDVRKRNFYRRGPRHHALRHAGRGQHPARADRRAASATQRLSRAPAQRSRRSTPTARSLKRGIALTPVKFGISFTTTHLNQAGALVHVYQDGSVHLNHGGTEMGQGLYIKVAQVVAEEFGVDARPGEDHRHHAPRRCRTRRRPPPPPAPTSTAWRRRMRPAPSRSG